VTYCLALRLDEGLVFLSDTRTNAGVDNISTYRKLHVVQPGDDRLFVIQSAGNLATTQEVLDRIDRDLATPGDHESLATVNHLFEAALYVGRVSRDVVAAHRDALSASGADGTATFILGGQISGERSEIFLVYPEGNYIRASNTRPFLQIGETKYGKFWLDMLLLHPQPDLAVATKIALASMLGTARANLSVGPPFDLGVYHNGSLVLDEHRIESGSSYLGELQQVFIDHLLEAFDDLPPIPWAG
jgi:putative proteasome-type protease